MKFYSEFTMKGNSDFEIIYNGITSSYEGLNYYGPMGVHISVGKNGDITYGNILSLGTNPTGSLVIDFSIPWGENSSVGMTIHFSSFDYSNHINSVISNTLGNALDRIHNHYLWGPMGGMEPILDPLLP